MQFPSAGVEGCVFETTKLMSWRMEDAMGCHTSVQEEGTGY